MGGRSHVNPFSGLAQFPQAVDELHMADLFAAVDQVAWDQDDIGVAALCHKIKRSVNNGRGFL